MFGTGIRDFDIHRDVLSELDWAQDVHSTEVGVQVSGGIVTLSGLVRSPLTKVSAIDAAHRVEGVRAVVDAMNVHLPALDGYADVDVARDVAMALERFGAETRDRVRVTVYHGCVTLHGQVANRAERTGIERALLNTRGVNDVVNSVSVADSRIDAEAIQSSIESSFHRMAEQAARRITIDMEDGCLVLRGTVDTWAERDEAERAAIATGSTRVENQIQVHPHMHTDPENLVYIAG